MYWPLCWITVSGNLGQNHVIFGIYSRTLWPCLFVYFMCRRELNYLLNAILVIWWALLNHFHVESTLYLPSAALSCDCQPNGSLYLRGSSSSSKQQLNPLCSFSKTCRKNQLITSHDINFSTSHQEARLQKLGCQPGNLFSKLTVSAISLAANACFWEVSPSWNTYSRLYFNNTNISFLFSSFFLLSPWYLPILFLLFC